MRSDNGGEHETLAPVIPLFGGAPPRRDHRAERADTEHVADSAEGFDDLDADAATEAPDAMAPVEPAELAHLPSAAVSWHPTWASDRARPDLDAADDSEGASRLDGAEKALLKKLRTRSLSVSEARGVLREHELDEAAAEVVLAAMEEYGYLDDAALAEQLVHAGVDRKGQGRQAIAQTLAKRGIARDVADAALAALPDDDLERALEFARGKARSFRDLDRDTALRRLSGQLARRGYGGSLATTAARMALDEKTGGSSGVRFS